MESPNNAAYKKVKVRKSYLFELVKKRWPSLIALGLAASGLPASTDPMSFLLVLIALVYPISGAIMGHLRGGRTLFIQAIALVIFSAIALVSLYVNRETGLILLAVGYIGHSIWDLFHFYKGRMVWRGYAEFCAVLDLLIAVVLIASVF